MTHFICNNTQATKPLVNSAVQAFCSTRTNRHFLMIRHFLTTIGIMTSCMYAETTPTSGTPFRPGEVWLDTEGNPILAHGGGVLWDEATSAYYWYGEQRTGATYEGETNPDWDMSFLHADTLGVACYRSPDLQNWTYQGIVLPSVEDPAHPLWRGGVINRPKVLRNPTTGKYVMWFHSDRSTYALARSGVAVADQPTGPFTFLDHDRAMPHESRDPSLFQDEDGTAYHLFTSENNSRLRVARLTSDYLKHDGTYADAFFEAREAPVMFQHAGRYYIIASAATGWEPNAAAYAVADHPLGPWTKKGNPCVGPGLPPEITAENTFRSQGTHIIPVPGRAGAFIFMANRWHPSDLIDSRHVWLPLVMNGDQPEIHWRTQWTPAVFEELKNQHSEE